MPDTPSTHLVLGASSNPERYSCKAIRSLLKREFDVAAVGLREGTVLGVNILAGQPELVNIDTILLYIGPEHQAGYYNYILSLKPRRLIFNPGTENPELQKLATENGIEVITDCALVMLSSNSYKV